MTLNPLHFAHEVNLQYLRYQVTSARLSDPLLAKQLKDQLWKGDSPLIKGPFVSLNRPFKEGNTVRELVGNRTLHPRVAKAIPFPRLYAHQEQALKLIQEGRDVLITTGTGSGKTEAFLYPIVDRCLRLNELPDSPKGVVAVLIYPMNALANDQLERLRSYLAGTGVTFGMYTGDTPQDPTGHEAQVEQMPPGTTPELYRAKRDETAGQENYVLSPPEERLTRDRIRSDPPRILLVNRYILEYLLTRADDLRILKAAPVEFVVMDEAHTCTGATGAEVALLLRRLASVVSPPKGSVTHIATSATIVDETHQDEGRRFMARLFGAEESNIAVVREIYEAQVWKPNGKKVKLPDAAGPILESALKAVSLPDGPEREVLVEKTFAELTGLQLPPGGDIHARVFEGLLHSSFASAIDRVASSSKPLQDLVLDSWRLADRGAPGEGSREECLTYLVLGAFAERDGAPLFRPKLHYFVKGLEGVVVVLDRGGPERVVLPEMFLSAALAMHRFQGRREPTAVFPVLVCPQCGQHHYEQFLEGVTSEPTTELEGGEQVEGGTLFRPDSHRSKKRILFTDTIVQGTADEGTPSGTRRHKSGWVCYGCGAIYTGEVGRCFHCERVDSLLPIWILDSVDRVKSCPVCRYNQGFATQYYKDPFRALREITVGNVYVLAQEMLREAEPEGRKLIIFADNRQEAAFQAGWIQDRARRYRFRQLLWTALVPRIDLRTSSGTGQDSSVESVVSVLTERLLNDKTKARLIAPEVFEEASESPFDRRWERALREFLTIQVLRELASSYNTRASLEGWGKLGVLYYGVTPGNVAVSRLAEKHHLDVTDLVQWLETLLDSIRKRRMLYFQNLPLFSRTWDFRHDLVQKRYLPPIEFHPQGMLLESREDDEPNESVVTWIGRGGLTSVQDWVRALQIPKERQDEFLRDVWQLLTKDLGLLSRLNALHYGNNKPISGTQNVYQLDASRIGLTTQNERYQCSFCGRIHPRATPARACSRYRCSKGRLIESPDDEPRDYDLVVLERSAREDEPLFVMAEEHTAQVPGPQRQRIEKEFKEGRSVNCLVATPTLELGVDIGALDMVLLRNVPPRPANYWQRTGRAGRRNRMAVVYTYARTNPHDIHYFANPGDLLGGPVSPPRFNLANPIMIRKHVHAAILTELFSEFQGEVNDWLSAVIPDVIGKVLFEDDRPRQDVASVVKPLLVSLSDAARKTRLLTRLQQIFTDQWPEPAPEVSSDQLALYLSEMSGQLQLAYLRVLSRLQWAFDQKRRLARKEAQGETLSQDEMRFRARCDETIRNLNPRFWATSDERRLRLKNYTLAVLAQEGFLPGYATYAEQIVASADQAFVRGGSPFEFDLTRPSSIAINEHLPGNRIYANGGKYQLAYYLFPATEEVRSPHHWLVDPERCFARNKLEIPQGYNNPLVEELPSLPLVDSQIRFISHVDDLETTRFRMPSQVVGILRRRHKGGTAYTAGEQTIEFRRAQYVTLLNLGPNRRDGDGVLGFPICRVCGGVRSPYERDVTLERFVEYHSRHCKEAPSTYALHVHATVDGIVFPGLKSSGEAASLGEALCLGCSQNFDMQREDLKILTVPDESDHWTLFLYDPMPGGSGLLQQLLDNWSTVVSSVRETLLACPGACPTSCYDCLRTYYNQFSHELLNRHLAVEALTRISTLSASTARFEAQNDVSNPESADVTANKWERALEHLVVDEWGFSGFSPQIPVDLPEVSSHTIPDLAHQASLVAIYLDGPDHDDPAQRQKDRFLRSALVARGWTVIEIPIQELGNDRMMELHRQAINHRLAPK